MGGRMKGVCDDGAICAIPGGGGIMPCGGMPGGGITGGIVGGTAETIKQKESLTELIYK